MRRSILSTCLCAFLLFALPAPTEASRDYDDVVLLDNGALIKGQIISPTDSEKIIVERRDGHRVEIPRDRIRLISKVDDPQVDSLQAEILAARKKWEWKTAWARFLRAEYLTGDSMKVGGLIFGVGLTVQGSFLLAAGVGYESWRDEGKAVPIFIEALGYVWRGAIWPFWYFDVGIMPFFAESSSNSEGEFFFGWGAGMVRPIGDDYAFGGRVGFRSQAFITGSNETDRLGLLSVTAEFHF